MVGRRSRLVLICLALLARYEKDRLPKLFIRKERTLDQRKQIERLPKKALPTE